MKLFKAMVWAMVLSLSVFFWMPAVAQENYSISNVGFFGGWVGKMVVKNNYAFMVQGTGFIVMDISEPLNPRSVASLLLPDEPTDFTIYGNTAFFIFSGKGLCAADISNPLTPVLFDKMLSLSVGYDSIICVAQFSSKIYAYIPNTAYQVFHIIDVTNPSDLKLVKSLSDPVIFKTVKNMVISGNRAFMVDSTGYGIIGTSYFQMPFYVVDMTNPENPVYTNVRYNTQGMVDSMYIHENKLYLGIGSDYISSKKGFQAFDVSNDNPSLFQDLGLYSTDKTVNNIFINGNYAYLGTGDTLTILNISNFQSASKVGSYVIPTIEGNFPSIKSVYANSTYAFLAVSGDNNSMYVLNISTPSDPKKASAVPSPWDIVQMLASGSRLYLLSNNNLWVYSLTTPASPSFLGNLSQPINGSIRMFAEGNYVYVSQLLTSPWDPQSGPDQVTAINATDPAQMTVAGTYRLTNRTFSGLFILAAKNGMLYLLVKNITTKTYLMEIVDMTNPGAPVKKGEYSLLGSGKAIAVENTTAYIGCQVSDTENKLLLVNVADPTALSSPGSIPLSGRPTCIVPKGNTLFVGVNTRINPNKWKIEVFDVSTLQKITETAEGSGSIFGMEIQNDTIFAGIHGGSVYMYAYENNTLISKGVCPSGATIGITTTTPDASGYGYVYTPEGYASDQESRTRGGSSIYISGSRGVIIQKFKVPPKILADCCVTTTVSPEEAKDDGCSAAPVRSPGVQCNSKVNVSATAASPWIFKEWTGAASGTNPTTDATASQTCSEAIAHFVKGCCVTTTVSPKEAEDAGCIAEPAKSQDVECNSKVTVSAKEAPPWIFKEWTGAASGTNLITEAIASERCSEAIAYFVLQPSLKIEAGAQNPKENTEVKLQSNVTRNRTNVVITHITLTTSAEDTWKVTQVEFESSGTGNEAEDIAEARLYRQSGDRDPELIGKLTSFTDNGTLTYTIDERIPPASTISLILVYDFKPNKVIPCKTYGVKIDKDEVTAKPVNYSDYVKFSNPATGGVIGGPSQVNGLIWTGDVNGDGKTDLTDVVIVLKILVGLIPDTDISCYMKSGLSVEANKLGLPEVIYMLQVVASVRAH